MENKFYDVVIAWSFAEHKDKEWNFSVESIFEKNKNDFQKEITDTCHEFPNSTVYVDLDNVLPGKSKLYFSNFKEGLRIERYAVFTKNTKKARKIVLNLY